MPTITNGKHSETLEKEQRICFNNFKRSALQILAISALNLCVCMKTCPMVLVAPFEDGSFCLVVPDNDKYRTYVLICQQENRNTCSILFQFYYILSTIQFFEYHMVEYLLYPVSQ